MRQWGFAQCVQSFLKLIVRTVIKETERTTARSRIVNNFSHHRIVVTEIQLIADTYLTGRVYQYIPQTEFFIQLAKKEYLDTGTGLFLITIQTGREYFRIIEDEHIFVIKVVQNIFEFLVLNLTCLSVKLVGCGYYPGMKVV